jgi:hypothetical protein
VPSAAQQIDADFAIPLTAHGVCLLLRDPLKAMDRPRSPAAPILMAMAIAPLVLLLATYVAGYLRLGRRFQVFESDATMGTGRCFEQQWLRDVYRPLGWTEAKATGKRTYITSSHDADPLLPNPFVP